jgi:hypothetical protein
MTRGWQGRIRLAVATLLILPAVASAQVIGVFADPSGSRCDLQAPLGQPTTAYVLFRNSGSSGIRGFEFGIRGLPQGWYASADYCPSCGVVLGSLFGEGATYGWPFCQTDDIVLIAPAIITATTELRNVELIVGARVPPTDPSFDCPLVALCDAPVYTSVCVHGQTTYVNSDTRCSVAVEQTSWGRVKALFE